MSDIAIGQVVAQMRALAARAGGEMGIEAADSGQGGVRFSDLMRQSIDDINQAMLSSRSMADAFEAGDESVSLTELMVNAQRASLEFQALTEVRNKLLNAYQDIMRMQV